MITYNTYSIALVLIALFLCSPVKCSSDPYGYCLIGLATQAGNTDAPVIAERTLGRVSSAPYITGDGFRDYADWHYDEMNEQWDPRDVKPGDVVFVKIEYLDRFLKDIHPRIPSRYILLTHNSDPDIPGKYRYILDDPKIIVWFGQNVDGVHPKLHALPLGIANRYWKHGDPKVFDAVRALRGDTKKRILLYMNFSAIAYANHEGTKERLYVYNLFKDKPFCTQGKAEAMYFYLLVTAQCKFVLSPRGGGLDCHRTWEALYMGAIPIFKTSASDSIYDGLPVLIVKSWDEVTPEFLEQKYKEMSQKTYQLEKLTLEYWLQLIDEYKKQA